MKLTNNNKHVPNVPNVARVAKRRVTVRIRGVKGNFIMGEGEMSNY